jgi:hypothetical protein
MAVGVVVLSLFQIHTFTFSKRILSGTPRIGDISYSHIPTLQRDPFERTDKYTNISDR